MTKLGGWAIALAIGMSPLAARGEAGQDRQVTMATISSDYPKGYSGQIIVELEERDGVERITRFVYTDSKGSRLRHGIEELPKGIVLLRALGKDLIYLYSKSFDPVDGGQITLVFYRRFLASDRRMVHFNYAREGGEWVLRTDDREGRDPFDSIGISMKMSFGQPVGVDYVTLASGRTQVRRYRTEDLPVPPARAPKRRRAWFPFPLSCLPGHC